MDDAAEWSKALREPCSVIQDFLEGGQSPRDLCEFFTKVANGIIVDEQQLSGCDEKKSMTIPLLGPLVPMPVSGSLVRVRCMVQDIFGSEMYPKRMGKYHTIFGGSVAFEQTDSEELASVSDEMTRDTLSDRTVYACVSIPEESSWVSSNSSRRGGDDDDDRNPAERIKRKICTDDGADCVPGTPSETTEAGQYPDFLVKVYDGGIYAADALRVNGLYEIVGVLETDLSLQGPTLSSDECFPESESLHNPPSLLCPRVHLLTCRDLSHGNGHHQLLPGFGCPFGAFKVSDGVPSFIPRTREAANCARGSVIAFLAQALGGDVLASEFVLLALMQKITARYDGINVGQLAVSVTGVTERVTVTNIIEALKLLWPRVACISLTIDMLNDAGSLAPYKDYTQERLVQTPLQLPVGTLVVLDETMLQSGKLTEKGQRNLQHIRDLVQWQRVSYDFAYHESEFSADCPVLSVCPPQFRRLPFPPRKPWRFHLCLYSTD